MYRKMTLLARAAKWGVLGASGLADADWSLAATCRAKNPSSLSKPVKATAGEPRPCLPEKLATRASTEFACFTHRFDSLVVFHRAVQLIEIHELIQVQHQQTEFLQGTFGILMMRTHQPTNECDAAFHLRFARASLQCSLQDKCDLRRAIPRRHVAGRGEQTRALRARATHCSACPAPGLAGS